MNRQSAQAPRCWRWHWRTCASAVALATAAALIAAEPAAAAAQVGEGPVSIAAAIAAALIRHPDAARAEARLAEVQAKWRDRRSEQLPTVRFIGSAIHGSDNNDADTQPPPGWDLRATLDVPVIAPAAWKRLEAAGFAEKAAAARRQADREAIAVTAAIAAIDAAAAVAEQTAAAEDQILSEAIAALADELARGGQTARIEAERAWAEVEAAKASAAESEGAGLSARIGLAVAMGVDPATPPWPAGQAIPLSAVPTDAAAALRLAGEHRPDLALAEFQIRLLAATVAAIRREPLPVISAFADAGTGALAGENAVGSWRVGVRASITVLDGLSRESRTDVNLALAAQARAEHTALLAATAGAVASAMVRVKSATKSADHWATAVVRSTTETSLARERLRGGLDDGLAVVEARGRLAKAKSKLIAARRTAALAAVALAAACGVVSDLRAP